MEIGPVATWSWWVIVGSFGATAAWWMWADATGYTKRKAVERMEKRKVDRRQKAMEALGLGPKGRKSRSTGASDSAVRTSAGALDQSDDRDLARRQDPRL